MSNFFNQAPPKDTHQKRFLETVLRKQHVIVSVPLGFSAPSLYALPTMMGQGLAVVVCAEGTDIRRNLAYFEGAGVRFPEVAFLDGSQMPHEERDVYQQVNRNRVKLLYVTVERFSSLTFLEILVHNELAFLLIEDADRLLPGTPGHASYRKFHQDGLSQLRTLPPIVLLVPPLPPNRFRELSERLKLNPYHLIQIPPLIEPVEIKVRCLFSEHQKYRSLVSQLSGSPEPGKIGRLDGTGSVLIRTDHPAEAEKLGASLSQYGFESVWVTHYKKSPKEQNQALDVANTRLNTILLTAGLAMRGWTPPPEASPRVVFWTPPAGVDEMTMHIFRQPNTMAQTGYGEQHFTRSLVLHTREDFESALSLLRPNQRLDMVQAQERRWALHHYRRWVLSESCRLQSLAAYLQGSVSIEVPPCGRCDRCTEKRPAGMGWLQRLLRRWLF